MNIFVLDNDPVIAASYLCDKHVPKMLLESAQLLCSPFHPGSAPYKRTHYNHPAAVWTRMSRDNFEWLLKHARQIAFEHVSRFGTIHASRAVLDWADANMSTLLFSCTGKLPFAQCMPEKYKGSDAVEAYRRYYVGEKRGFATWKYGNVPPWWPK